MNIQDATKKAVESGGFITRHSWRGHVQIKPTNVPEHCLVYTIWEKFPFQRWEPDADDLMADDWEVTTEELI